MKICALIFCCKFEIYIIYSDIVLYYKNMKYVFFLNVKTFLIFINYIV